MTKAHAIRQYYKKVYDLDLEGMSTVAVLKDMFKKKYNMDVEGSSVVSILQNAMGDEGGGATSAVVGTAVVGSAVVGSES